MGYLKWQVAHSCQGSFHGDRIPPYSASCLACPGCSRSRHMHPAGTAPGFDAALGCRLGVCGCGLSARLVALDSCQHSAGKASTPLLAGVRPLRCLTLPQIIVEIGVLGFIPLGVVVSSSFVDFSHCLLSFHFLRVCLVFSLGSPTIIYHGRLTRFFLHVPSCVFSSSSVSLYPHSFYSTPQFPNPSLKYLSRLLCFSFSLSYLFSSFRSGRFSRFSPTQYYPLFSPLSRYTTLYPKIFNSTFRHSYQYLYS